ncbi:MAG: MFS transporter [Alphaproteobacteria bacterium HGW-Alphaproteobacteria-11]|nr:MAG: MFS transporter [Alphaproteobacteria bacterium HGW-Alphaproteobacteria-11]
MLGILRNRTYRHLFAAQILSVLGTGLMSVALALLAYDLAGENAGIVLGTALAIKMVAYVGVGFLAGAFAGRLPRRGLLVALDVVRACVVLALPFVDAIWQVYVLIALLQSASAIFTPAFQATIPDILSDERDYTRALSLSRLAMDLENLASPVLAAVLVALFGYSWLFAGTSLGFVASALLVLAAVLLKAAMGDKPGSVAKRMTRGAAIYLKTPRLRGLLALNLSVAAAGAMVIVNTVVVVRAGYGLGEADVAIAFAVFGGGSMLAALALPRLLERRGDRAVMVSAAACASLLLCTVAASFGLRGSAFSWTWFLAALALLGFFYSAVQVPTGRLLRRSAHAEDRPAIFSAQFALSHACWLVTYPLAGWLGATAGMPATLAVLGIVAGSGAAAAALLWRKDEEDDIRHAHPDLPPHHPHLKDHGAGASHVHVYVIDDLHRHWPAAKRPWTG